MYLIANETSGKFLKKTYTGEIDWTRQLAKAAQFDTAAAAYKYCEHYSWLDDVLDSRVIRHDSPRMAWLQPDAEDTTGGKRRGRPRKQVEQAEPLR